MAGAAIGVSHLVQSTRAGAMYGWGALIFVLLANLMKYPFYEYGHRYAGSIWAEFDSGVLAAGKAVLCAVYDYQYH